MVRVATKVAAAAACMACAAEAFAPAGGLGLRPVSTEARLKSSGPRLRSAPTKLKMTIDVKTKADTRRCVALLFFAPKVFNFVNSRCGAIFGGLFANSS